MTEPRDEKLHKVVARAGYASRRNAETLIAAGRVTVDGAVAEVGQRVDPSSARIEIDGIPIVTDPTVVYYLLHKPAGHVSTTSDPHAAAAVVELVPSEPRVYPAGRLDTDTEGLLILTNDGELTHRLTHPSFGVEKEYLAHVQGVPSAGALRVLRDGVMLDDGVTAPARVSIAAREAGATALTIVLHEGRNRQVRRMCEAVGHPVLRLVRTRIGPLTDHRLRPGQWRRIEAAEVRALYAATAARGGGDGPGAPDQ